MLSHCQTLHAAGRLPAAHRLEAEVYMLVLNGRFLRFRDEFDDALAQLSVARGLLDALAGAAATSRDQALATLFADEIGPEIRYCAHELGRAKAYDVDGIVAELAGKHTDELVQDGARLRAEMKAAGASSGAGAQKKLAPLEWEGEPVPIRNPELVDVLLKVQDGEAKLRAQQGAKDRAQGEGDASKASKSKRGVAAYDAVLSALSDAEDVARKLAESQQVINLVLAHEIACAKTIIGRCRLAVFRYSGWDA
jgi:signal recognition particle subunit SRP68